MWEFEHVGVFTMSDLSRRTCPVGLAPSDDWGNSWTSQRISKVRKCESSGVLKKARGKVGNSLEFTALACLGIQIQILL